MPKRAGGDQQSAVASKRRLWADVSRREISSDDLLSRVGAEEDGAVALFLGVVRDHNEGKPVAAVHYEGYEEMARSVLEEIIREASAPPWRGRIAAVHRLGELEVGETSVAIAASSPHRAEAFEAARRVIEEIKVRLPLWKKERYVGGEEAWLDGVRPEPS